MIIDIQEPIVPIEVGLDRLERGLEEVSVGLCALRAAQSAQLWDFQTIAKEFGIDLPTDLPTEEVPCSD